MRKANRKSIKKIKFPSRKKPKVLGFTEPGRNEECPCRSGKKYKKCCLI